MHKLPAQSLHKAAQSSAHNPSPLLRGRVCRLVHVQWLVHGGSR